jgi:hypothetical protein
MDRRREHVRLLAIFHFVYAGIAFLGSLVPVFWLLTASIWWPELSDEIRRESSGAPVAASGAVALAFASFGVLLAWVWAGVLVVSGRNLLAQRNHTFCMVVAGIACLSVPLGTILGITSLVILNREEVRQLFPPTGPPPVGGP